MKESFVFSTANRIEGGQVKDDKLAREHGMAFWLGCLKETNCLCDLDTEGACIIKMDLAEYEQD
jgi:hypothetical protein